MLKIKNARAVLDSAVKDTAIYVEGGKIACLSEVELPADEEMDAAGRYVAPGFIDARPRWRRGR
ncbi:MAG: hypothetical protein J6V07_01045 [Clostridia bacterium]|nr:hypothetical protein [Clostridia bacterium]